MIVSDVPWANSPVLDDQTWTTFRRRAIFACRKWDHQVEDTATIARGPLVLTQKAWKDLTLAAEQLAQETHHLELELLQRPQLWPHLGLDRRVRRALTTRQTGSSVRVMRFDFHWTTEGWRVSEVNADVPGGFNEAAMSPLIAPLIPGCRPVSDPGTMLIKALLRRGIPHATVALVHATAYSDDRQVMEYLSDVCAQHNLQAIACAPDQLQWTAKFCHGDGRPVGAILRFFPGDWVSALPTNCGWEHFAGHPTVVQANPLTAMLVQSKRLPLVWDSLPYDCPNWKKYLPTTDRPRASGYGRDPEWVLKPAFGRVGEDIVMAGVTPEKQRQACQRAAWWTPSLWISQRRFSSVPWHGPEGPCHVCIGVYTVDGVVAGAYGRYASAPIIDQRAVDIPVLVEA